jgi:hypothetical protein
MPDKSRKDRLAYYRERTAEARAKADKMSDFEARADALQVARMWELMEEIAEKQAGPAS